MSDSSLDNLLNDFKSRKEEEEKLRKEEELQRRKKENWEYIKEIEYNSERLEKVKDSVLKYQDINQLIDELSKNYEEVDSLISFIITTIGLAMVVGVLAYPCEYILTIIIGVLLVPLVAITSKFLPSVATIITSNFMKVKAFLEKPHSFKTSAIIFISIFICARIMHRIRVKNYNNKVISENCKKYNITKDKFQEIKIERNKIYNQLKELIPIGVWEYANYYNKSLIDTIAYAEIEYGDNLERWGECLGNIVSDEKRRVNMYHARVSEKIEQDKAQDKVQKQHLELEKERLKLQRQMTNEVKEINENLKRESYRRDSWL